MKRLVTLALASTMLVGCVNLAPEHTRPELATAPAFDPAYRPDGTVVASQLSYREWYQDPRLQDLIASALANNRDLMAATARIEQARASFRIENSRRLPSVVATASGTRTRQATAGNPAIGAGGGNLPASFTFNRYDIGVGVSSFELDFWGRVKNLSEAGRASYLASVATQRAFYLSLIADTATTYFEIVETEEQIVLAEATAASRREGLQIAKLRLDAGVTSALPYRQAETLLTQAEQQIASERLALAQLRNQLAVLVGGTVPDNLPQGLSLAGQADERRLAAGLPSELLSGPARYHRGRGTIARRSRQYRRSARGVLPVDFAHQQCRPDLHQPRQPVRWRWLGLELRAFDLAPDLRFRPARGQPRSGQGAGGRTGRDL